jgi:hypothetical protein
LHALPDIRELKSRRRRSVGRDQLESLGIYGKIILKWLLKEISYDDVDWGQPLWSSGQSSWLQIQRSGF